MKTGKLKRVLGFLGPIVLLLLGVTFLVVWELYLKENINRETVVVAKDTIEFKDKITADDLELKNVNIDNVVSGGYKESDIDSIVNGYASIEIKKGTQLYPELVDYYDIIPDESKGEFIAPLPDAWLFAVPGSLRRTYVADIYAVGTDDQKMLESLIKDSKTAGDAEGEDAKETSETSDTIVETSLKPILKDVRISSVKDSSNKEVQELEGVSDGTSSTGKISTLEIIATDDMLNEIQNKTGRGYQLYIVYKYERSSDSSKSTEKTEQEASSN